MTLLQVDKDIEKEKMRMKSQIDVRASVMLDAEGVANLYVVL